MCKYKTVDTSIKHQISGHYTSILKGCIDICLIWKILPLVKEEHWSFTYFFWNYPRQKKVLCVVCDLKCTYCSFTLGGKMVTGPQHFRLSANADLLQKLPPLFHQSLICNYYGCTLSSSSIFQISFIHNLIYQPYVIPPIQQGEWRARQKYEKQNKTDTKLTKTR